MGREGQRNFVPPSRSCATSRLRFLSCPLVLFLLLTNASYFVSGSDEDGNGYCRLCKRHTMCLYSYDEVGFRCINVENANFDPEEIQAIVHQHNLYRNNIAKGLEMRGKLGPQPPGKKFMELTWDEELAKIARTWALQCNFDEKDECRDVDRFQVWQNVNVMPLDSSREEDAAGPHDQDAGIEEEAEANATATTSSFARIRSHVKAWLDEVEHFDNTRVGLVDFAMENETSYVAIACAMITRVGCGRATYRENLVESTDEVEVDSVPSETMDNRNDSGSGQVEVLVCNYGPIDRSTPQNLYEHGTFEQCPEGSEPSYEYDHLCVRTNEPFVYVPREMEYRDSDEETLDPGWQGIVASPGRREEREKAEGARSSAVSIAYPATTSARIRGYLFLPAFFFSRFFVSA